METANSSRVYMEIIGAYVGIMEKKVESTVYGCGLRV